jgi:hypothetical protein
VDVNTFPGYEGVLSVAPRIAGYIEGPAAAVSARP